MDLLSIGALAASVGDILPHSAVGVASWMAVIWWAFRIVETKAFQAILRAFRRTRDV